MSNVLNMVSEESFIAQTEKIVKAITGESGTPFALAPEGTIQAAGKWFRVPYLGEAPAVQSATLILPDLPQGLVANSNWSVGFANGVANFTAINAADDTTYSGTGFVVIGNTAPNIIANIFWNASKGKIRLRRFQRDPDAMR